MKCQPNNLPSSKFYSVIGTKSGVSVKFLMVGETNSMVGYHLMAEGH